MHLPSEMRLKVMGPTGSPGVSTQRNKRIEYFTLCMYIHVYKISHLINLAGANTHTVPWTWTLIVSFLVPEPLVASTEYTPLWVRSASLTNRVLDPAILIMSMIFLVISTPSRCHTTLGTGRPVMVTFRRMLSPALTVNPSKYSGPNSMFGAANKRKIIQVSL